MSNPNEETENINQETSIGEKTTSPETTIGLELGDVIKIIDPMNEILNEQTFIIEYIDNTKIALVNIETQDKKVLKINEDKTLGTGTIQQINLLSRSEFPGYARQNGLLPNTWINIYFGGEVPIILTGEITNLEQDMIEVTTFPERDVIYINFDCKGIPEDIPIENIEIREKPQGEKEGESEIVLEEGELEEGELPQLDEEQRGIQTEKLALTIPVEKVKEQLTEFIIRSNQIEYGAEEFGPIIQYVNVDPTKQRYSIEVQVSDLLDDLLSTIPNIKRTNKVLDNIHIMIERFKQLREKFSSFDEYGNVESALVYESDYKPLSEYFIKLNTNLLWILPVVKNIKKVYDVDLNEDIQDIQEIQLTDDISKIQGKIAAYKDNNLPDEDNKYATLYKDLNPFFTPFDYINEESNDTIIYEANVKMNLTTIINNLGNFYSYVIKNNNVRTKKYIIQKYNLGLTRLVATNLTGSKMLADRVELTEPDLMSIRSFITLPEPTIRFSRINLPGTNILERANLNNTFLNYWQILNTNRGIDNVFVDSINQDIEFNEENFANNIKNFVLELTPQDARLTQDQLYKKFIKTIIPKTRILFNLMKKYITGKLSIVDVVSYLEPFLVYSDNLTYQQYKDIIQFIYTKISEYNKNFSERGRNFATIKRSKSEPLVKNRIFNLIYMLDNANNSRENVLDAYDFHDLNGDLFSNSELLRKVTIKDYGKLYNNTLSLQSAHLMFPSEFSVIFDKEKGVIGKKITDANAKDECKTITIAKLYTTETQMMEDNDKTIFFDRNYDKTFYGFLD